MESSAWADEPIKVEPPLPDLQEAPSTSPTKPSPITITMPPPQGTAVEAPPPSPPPPSPKAAQRSSWTEIGVGPTYFGAIPSRSGAKIERPGVVFEVSARAPVSDHLGIGFRLAWGLTEFYRTEAVAKPGYRIGQWTSHAYGNVWDWAGEGKTDERPVRYFGAFFAFIFLVLPYAVALPFYVFSPLAATTYLETDLTLDYDFGDEPKSGPYVKGGIGLMAYIHPKEARLYGGVGPSIGLGYRVGSVDIGLGGTYLPPGLHGGSNEHILVGALAIGVGHAR